MEAIYLGIPCCITLAGALREKIEYDVSKIYTELTWPDFDCLEPQEAMEMCRGKVSSSSTLSSPESRTLSNILLDLDVGGCKASELDLHWVRLDLAVAISMSLSLSNNEAALQSAAWGS